MYTRFLFNCKNTKLIRFEKSFLIIYCFLSDFSCLSQEKKLILQRDSTKSPY